MSLSPPPLPRSNLPLIDRDGQQEEEEAYASGGEEQGAPSLSLSSLLLLALTPLRLPPLSSLPNPLHYPHSQGNDLFKLSHFADAVQCYSKAIDKAEKAVGISTSGGTGDGSEDGRREARERSVYYLNRAQGWLKLEKYALSSLPFFFPSFVVR